MPKHVDCSATQLAQSAPALSRLSIISQTLTNLSCLHLPCLFSGVLRTWHRSLQIPSDVVSRRAPSGGFLLRCCWPNLHTKDAEHERRVAPLPANVCSTRPGLLLAVRPYTKARHHLSLGACDHGFWRHWARRSPKPRGCLRRRATSHSPSVVVRLTNAVLSSGVSEVGRLREAPRQHSISATCANHSRQRAAVKRLPAEWSVFGSSAVLPGKSAVPAWLHGIVAAAGSAGDITRGGVELEVC